MVDSGQLLVVHVGNFVPGIIFFMVAPCHYAVLFSEHTDRRIVHGKDSSIVSVCLNMFGLFSSLHKTVC